MSEAENTTTINIRGVDKKAWEKAKNAANKQGETMGTWISRAFEQLANLESGQREFPPLPAQDRRLSEDKLSPKSVNHDAQSDASLALLLHAAAAIGEAKAGRTTPGLKSLLRERIAAARGVEVPLSKLSKLPALRHLEEAQAGDGDA